jgi:hypothetical protein
MDRETLQQWLKRKPFQPIRVHVADGRVYDIRYPRTYLLAYTYIVIGVPARDLPPGVCDHSEYVALKDIMHLELLPSSHNSAVTVPVTLPNHAGGCGVVENGGVSPEHRSGGDAGIDRDTLRQWLNRIPFQPFRVYVADGRIYNVRHPRTNLLAHTFIKIGVPAPDLPIDSCDHTEYVALKDITRLEPLNAGPIAAAP